MKRYEFNIYADHHIIELADSGGLPLGSSEAICNITDDDLYRWMKVVPGIVAIYTARYGDSPIVVEMLAGEPPADFDPWNHVVESSLEVASGYISVCGLLGDGGHIEAAPGCYRVRAYYAKLDSVTDPDGEGDDYYLVHLWPAPSAGFIVLKQYAPET